MSKRFLIAFAVGVLVVLGALGIYRFQSKSKTVSKLTSSSISRPMSKEAALVISSEMIQTLGGEPSAISGWANVLSQGATVEGVFRGITLSESYEKREEKALPINSKQVKRVIELARLMEWSTPEDQIRKNVSKMSALQIARIASEKYLRLLGDAKLMNRNEVAEKIYIKLVAWSLSHGTDLGLPERMNSDLEFHRNWFRHSNDNFIAWEGVHRIYKGLLYDKK